MTLTSPSARWPAALTTLLIWALAVAGIAFWVLRLAAPADAPPPPAVTATPAAATDPATVAKLLGAVSAESQVVLAPDAASRFALMGVVASTMQHGAALIAVDGKPARPFRVGGPVGEGYVLQSVSTRSASLGARVDAPTAFVLQMPMRPMALSVPQPLLPMAPR
ncbi:MAG: type II secretion system protein N [Janthinobacterium lividum]